MSGNADLNNFGPCCRVQVFGGRGSDSQGVRLSLHNVLVSITASFPQQKLRSGPKAKHAWIDQRQAALTFFDYEDQ